MDLVKILSEDFQWILRSQATTNVMAVVSSLLARIFSEDINPNKKSLPKIGGRCFFSGSPTAQNPLKIRLKISNKYNLVKILSEDFQWILRSEATTKIKEYRLIIFCNDFQLDF